MPTPHAPAASHEDHDSKPHGWRRWVYATNHKDIGPMYLIFASTMFFIGGLLAMLIRLELFQPGLQFWDPQLFNSFTTMHALIMIFGAIMPAWVGLANWMIPMQVGAPDMALPRLNNLSFWILPFAFTLLLSTFFVPGGAPAGGWTMYPPLMLQTGASFPMLIFSIHLMGASSILGAINVIVTILNMRAPGMTLLRMPLFVWTWLITAYLLIAVMPVLAGAVTMLLTDAVRAGVPVPLQHRRLLGADARDRAGRLPVPGHLLRGRALPLRAGAGQHLRHHGRGVLLAAEMDRPDVRPEARHLALLAVGDLRERAVLPAALPRTRRHAAPHPRLRGAVHRLEHGVLDRRLRLRPVAAAVPLPHLEVRAGRRAHRQQGLGGRARARVGAVFAAAVSLVDDAPVGCGDRARRRALISTRKRNGALPLSRIDDVDRRKRIRRTALVCALIALAFYFAFILMSLVRGLK